MWKKWYVQFVWHQCHGNVTFATLWRFTVPAYVKHQLNTTDYLLVQVQFVLEYPCFWSLQLMSMRNNCLLTYFCGRNETKPSARAFRFDASYRRGAQGRDHLQKKKVNVHLITLFIHERKKNILYLFVISYIIWNESEAWKHSKTPRAVRRVH